MTLEVIGVGLPRTGTRTLCKCLQILGYRTEHENAGKRLPGAWRWDHVPELQVFDDLTAVVEWQHWWRTAMVYAGADLILTVRDEEDWYRSIKRHIEAIYEDGDATRKQAAGLIHTFCFGSMKPHKVLFLDRYHCHRLAVTGFAYTAGRRLLIFDPTKQDWGSLCAFLKKPIPEAPFPWKNRLATPSP